MKKLFRRKKLLKTCAVLFFVLILFVVWVNVHTIIVAKPFIVDSDDVLLNDADCILILGALVWKNGKPSHILEDRLLSAIELYDAGFSSKLLMTGDHGQHHYNEVQIMKGYAMARGVVADDIFMDHAGFSTYDSCYRARDVFCAKKIIIVTQKYHLYRAVYIARSLGLDAYGVASDRRIILGQTKRDVREVLARVKAFFALQFGVRPKYLGEKIPITTADASATDG